MFSGEILIKNKEQNILKNNKITRSDSISLDIFNEIISSISSLYVRNKKSSEKIELNNTSIKRIFSNGQLDKNKYILFYYNKELLSLKRIEKREKEKEMNEETTEDDEESMSSVKEDEDAPSPKNINTENKDKDKDKQAITLDIKNKQDNIFNPEFPLLQNKITNTFSNIEHLPQKYINLIIFCNRITISLDYLKCIYLTLFICGLFNLIYFFDILFSKNASLDNIYHIFCLPLAIILMITGIYGYKKRSPNKYDDENCIRLTYLSFFAPICSFAFSIIYLEGNTRKNFMMNVIINTISSFFSFLAIIILKEFERVKNTEKNILNA